MNEKEQKGNSLEREFEFILKEGEGLKIEFKKSFDKSLAKEIVAFANSIGGKIFLGIDDRGKIKGINITNALKSQIQDLVRKCDPAVKINFEEFNKILIINVEEGKDKPYKCSTGFYLRQSANSQKLTREEIREFFNREGKILFDEMIHKSFSFKNGFDEDKYNFFLQKAKISKVILKKEILKNLSVLNDQGKFNNAGVLFFCDKIEHFIPQAVVACVLYKGKDKVYIIDKKDFTGDLYSNYQHAVDFLYRNLKLKYEIKGFGPRKEILEIPEEALKEAIVNALAHRDYLEKGAEILIEIYDDRVEITNPGGLVAAIKKSEFGQKSVSRNPLIFSLFKRIDLVEKVGSGINRMRKAMKKAGLLPPKFKFTNFFTVIFKRPISEEAKVGIKVGAKLTENQKRVLEKVLEKVLENVTENQKKILIEIIVNPHITTRDLAGIVGISERKIRQNISKLKAKGLLKRIGPAKGGYWEIIK